MEFLRLFLRRHLAGKPAVALPNVGCFLRQFLIGAEVVAYKRWSHMEVQLHYTTYIDSMKKSLAAA